MTRRSLLAMLVAAVALIGTIGMTRTASAQNNPNICTYTVDVAGIPPCCFPINLQTEWNCLGAITMDNKAIPGNGVFVFPLNPPGGGPCPPACLFNWASLNGIINPTPLGQTKQYVINGCCYRLTAALDAAGQVYLTIRPCIV
ncbi:MAG: hypothetical protein JST22_19225 [Bacteroidetes bacterium]|nr:hypothetical protein [Bacteroidota bacterium]